MAERRGANPVKAVGMAVGAGAATFLMPPVMVDIQAVKDYREKQQAEQQHNLAALTNCLRSHGISSSGAAEMANQIIMNHSIGHRISTADFKLWMVVASVIEPELAQYTPRIAQQLESNKPKINLA